MSPQRSRDMNGFEVLFLNHVLPIFILVWLGPALLDHHFDHCRTSFGIDVTERFKITKLFLILVQQALAHISCTDEGNFHWTTLNWTTGRSSAAKNYESRYSSYRF